MGEARLPRRLDDLGAALDGGAAARVPPGRLGVRGQARQGHVEHAGLQQAVEEGLAQFVLHRRAGQLIGQLVEQRRGDGVQFVVAVPGRQALDQLLLVLARGRCPQLVEDGGEQTRGVAGSRVQLQRLAVVQVPLHAGLGELLVQALAAVRQVVVAGDGHARGRLRLVVGGNDVAARRVLFLRVGAEGQVAGLVRLAGAAVEDEVGVHPIGALRQPGGGPPADVAVGVGPDHVQPRRMDLLGGGAGLAQAVGAVELVEGVEYGVLGFEEGPPHGDRRLAGGGAEGIVDDRAVGRAAQGQPYRLAVLDLDGLLTAFQVYPAALIPDLVGVVRVALLGNQVEVVVLEHGQAPGELLIVPQRGDRIECLVVAVEVEAGIAQLRLVPDGRHGEADVRVAGQQRFATGGAAAGHGPGIAAFELRQAGLDQGLLAEVSQPVEVLPVGAGQGLADHAFRMPVEVEGLQVVGAQLVAHVGQYRLGTEGGGEAVGHVAHHGEGVLDREGALADAQQVELHRCGTAVLKLVHAIEVGLQRLGCRAVHVQLACVVVGVRANAQGAEQAVGIDQAGAEDLGEFATGQAPQHFHLEQPVLGVDEAEGAVHVGLIGGLDMRHAAFVIAHRDGRREVLQGQFAAALRLAAFAVPGGAGGGRGDDDGQGGQGAFHARLSLL
ncbi:hypothetical protein D9M71_126580 [compost metagenome]